MSKPSYVDQSSPVQTSTQHFACDSAAIAYSIGRLTVDLRNQLDMLVGADRLTVKSLLDVLDEKSLRLLIWSQKAKRGVLPR